MAEVTEKIISIRTQVEGANTVKELKSQISDLSTQLKNTDSSAEGYQKTIEDLVAAEYKLNETMKAGKSQLAALPGSYNDLVNKMAALKTVMKSVNDEATRSQLSTEINDLNNQLKAMDAANGVYSRNVGNYMGALSGLSLEFKNQRDELKQLKTLMEQLPTSSQAYAEAFTRAAEITHNMADQTERLKYASPDLGDQLNNVRGIASNLAAGYSAVNAAMGLFGEESEDLQKVMLKVQQAMALVQGLQGMDGLIKRTEGLSKAMGLVKVAEVESAAASTADATAKTAEGVATEGATVAQKGLNAAMKANPIGAIIAVVTALIGVFVLLKDDIIELVGGQDKLNKSTEKVKVVLSGLGNVIKQIVLGPIKLLITNVKTLVNVFKNLSEGNFKGAWQAIKDGAKESAEAVKDMIDAVGNYTEAATEKAEEQEKEKTKKKNEEYIKDKDNYIKNQEAKEGADWKYTEEGKKAYEDYYKRKMELYDKDSDEFMQAQRDMWAYEREYISRSEKAQSDASKSAEEKRKTAAQKRKAEEDKLLSSFESKIASYGMDDNMEFKLATIERNILLHSDKAIGLYKANIMKKYQLTNDEADTIIQNIFDNLTDRVAKEKNKLVSTAIDNQLYNIRKSAEVAVENLNTTFEAKKLTLGIEFPKDEFDHIQESFDLQNNSIQSQLDIVGGEMTKLYEKYAKIMASDGTRSFTDEQIKQMDLYKELEEKKTDLISQQIALRIQKIKDESEIRKEALKLVIDEEKSSMQSTIKAIQDGYDTMHTFGEVFGDNYIQLMYARREAEDKIYEESKNGIQSMIDKYNESLTNSNLLAEERLNIKQEIAKLTMELEENEVNHTIECNKRKGESYSNYFNAVSSGMQGVANILGNVSKAMEQSIQNEVDAGKMSEEEAKNKFETVKKVQTAEAYINAFASAAGAYNSLASIPYVGPALGAAAAVAALASGIAQAESIKNTSWNGGGSSSSSRYAEVTPTQTDYNPTMMQNISGEQETTDLANAVSKAPIKTYVVESEVSAKQELATKRTNETTF